MQHVESEKLLLELAPEVELDQFPFEQTPSRRAPHGRMRPFDGIDDLPGEHDVHAVEADVEGEGVADVQDRANLIGSCPAQVIISNYRLRLFEPTKGGATLHATVCSGHNLRSKQSPQAAPASMSLEKADKRVVNPYVVLSLTGTRHRSVRCPKRTTTVEKTLDPVWNETFIFEGVESDACLRVELFDRKSYGRDDMLGVCLVRGVVLWNGEGDCRQWTESFTVKDHENEVGAVRMRMSCIWHTEQDQVARHCSIPLTSIQDVELNEQEHTVEITTKSARQLVVRLDDSEKAKTVHQMLCSWPESPERFVCFAAQIPREYSFSWDLVLKRLADVADDSLATHGVDARTFLARWRVDRDINKGYRLCDTYPEVLLLPAHMGDEDVEASAGLRSKARFPCVSWAHPRNGASIARCSQPQTGVWASKSSATLLEGDRKCLLAYAANSNGEITICDCRPYINMMANRIKGGGTESEADFEGAHHKFLNIGNIHDMSKSLLRLREGVEKQGDFKALSAGIADWMAHIHNLLLRAIYVAEVVESGESVIVHCSEGWDRTSQICSLASLLLDGHYRTVLGFAELIEKDWLMPGHKFQSRHGLTAKSEQVIKDQSPVFLQFIDCVCQLWRIYPERFEYTLEFLSYVLYHSYSGRFTNFLGNSERDRAELRARSTGACLWTDIQRQPDHWLNPAFDVQLAMAPIVPCIVPAQRLVYVEELYSGQCSVWEHGPDARSRRSLDWTEGVAGEPIPDRFVRKDMDIEKFLPSKLTASPRHSRSRGMSSSIFFRSWTGARTASQSMRTNSRITSSSYVGSSYISETGTDMSHYFAERISDQAATLPDNLQDAEYAVRHFLGLPDNFPGRPNIKVMSHTSLGDHTRYIIVTQTLQGGPSIWQVTRRWSRFDDLRRTLRDLARITPQVPFPKWTFFQPSQQLKDQRTHLLSQWLQTAIDMLVQVELAALEGRIVPGPSRGACCRRLAACRQAVLECVLRGSDGRAGSDNFTEIRPRALVVVDVEDGEIRPSRTESSFSMRNPSSFLDADALVGRQRSRQFDGLVARQDSRFDMLARQDSRLELTIPEDASINPDLLRQDSRLDLPIRRESALQASQVSGNFPVTSFAATSFAASEDSRRQADGARPASSGGASPRRKTPDGKSPRDHRSFQEPPLSPRRGRRLSMP